MIATLLNALSIGAGTNLFGVLRDSLWRKFVLEKD